MKAIFIRLIEAEDKAKLLKASITGMERQHWFVVETGSFTTIPGSPFAYWATESIQGVFTNNQGFESQRRHARQGGVPGDDFRRLRLAWEIASDGEANWKCYAKGGRRAGHYADIHLKVRWDEQRQSFHAFTGLPHRPSLQPASYSYYFRPGITWPRRTEGLSFRVMPGGCIFGDKGPSAFTEEDDTQELLALLAVTNSIAFDMLVGLQLARTELAQSFEVGLIQQTPLPQLSAGVEQKLAGLARQAWSLKRRLDTTNESSHAFLLPALLQVSGVTLTQRANNHFHLVRAIETEITSIQATIDEYCFVLYGISEEDRRRVERGFGNSDTDPIRNCAIDEAGAQTGAYVEPLVAPLILWSVGVAFGRFDVRFAIGAQPMPNEPEPFEPLPFCFPGMLTGDDDLPLLSHPPGYPVSFPADGIFVDDEGHAADLVSRSWGVFEKVFDEHEARWHEAAELVGARNHDLRDWFAKDLFAYHIKQYSKSRRKAPIYWQLSTPSAAYSVWCYYHRLTRDTFFRVANDYVAPKVDHEERKLNTLRREAGPDPSNKQRKKIDAQEAFVAELRAFLTEVKRIAPLWNPNLNDGVIINFAPLWKLVPQHKSWQKECKLCWDKLCKGDYDWAHLAMHLWPERVVPKCQDDRSLAIAHGLEDAFWYEDENGKETVWKQRPVSTDRVAELVAERSSTAVKAALEDLLSAPTPSGNKRRTRRGGGA